MNESTYGKTDLIDDLTARTSGLTRSQIQTVLDTALDLIQGQVQAGNRVTITGFGTWQQSHHQARMGTNIRTKEKISIPARTGVRWTAGSVFKNAVSGASSARSSYARERQAGSGRK
jgi:DNA-binding protein HU-beta